MPDFPDSDQAYFAWLAANPNGYVVNCYENPSPIYLVLHRATCRHIASPARRVGNGYRKVCSNDAAELDRWAANDVGGSLSRGCTCRP